MIKLLVLAVLIFAAVRWATGAWPWTWLSRDTSQAARLNRARRLLAVSPGAGRDEISMAYRRHAAQMHPDRGGSDAALAALTEARDLLLANLPETRR